MRIEAPNLVSLELGEGLFLYAYILQVEECERALKESGEMTDALQESFKMVRRYSRFMSDEELIRLLEIIFAFVGIRDVARIAVMIVSKISSETAWDLFKLM